jgi:hypothetical protein
MHIAIMAAMVVLKAAAHVSIIVTSLTTDNDLLF